MKKLTEKEEAIMAIIWRADRAFAKDVRHCFDGHP